VKNDKAMTTQKEMQEIRALAYDCRVKLDRLDTRLRELEFRVLKDTSSAITLGRRVQFKNGPSIVHGLLMRAAGPTSLALLRSLILKDYPEFADDMDYANRAVRNALQVLKRKGKVVGHTPQGRLRETVWWAQGMEFVDLHENGEAANGGLGIDERGRVK